MNLTPEQKKIKEKRDQSIKEDALAGVTYKEIANKYNITSGRISQVLRELGLIPKKIYNRAEIIKDYKDNLRIKDIAIKYNTTPASICRIAKNAGLPKRIKQYQKTYTLKHDTTNLEKVKIGQVISGRNIKPYIRELYDPKNIITKEVLGLTYTYD